MHADSGLGQKLEEGHIWPYGPKADNSVLACSHFNSQKCYRCQKATGSMMTSFNPSLLGARKKKRTDSARHVLHVLPSRLRMLTPCRVSRSRTAFARVLRAASRRCCVTSVTEIEHRDDGILYLLAEVKTRTNYTIEAKLLEMWNRNHLLPWDSSLRENLDSNYRFYIGSRCSLSHFH